MLYSSMYSNISFDMKTGIRPKSEHLIIIGRIGHLYIFTIVYNIISFICFTDNKTIFFFLYFFSLKRVNRNADILRQCKRHLAIQCSQHSAFSECEHYYYCFIIVVVVAFSADMHIQYPGTCYIWPWCVAATG